MSTHVTPRALFLASILCLATRTQAQTRTPQSASTPAEALIETLRHAPQTNSVRWFASTDPKGRNEDYLLLKPNETRRIPLAAGTLTRLWCTALKPEKITFQLQNGGSPIDLLRGGRAIQGEMYEEAFTFYPTERTPFAVRQLKSDVVLIVHNGDAQPNKFFYQASVSQEKPETVEPLRFIGYPIQSATYSEAIRPGGMMFNKLGIIGHAGIISQIRINAFPASDAALNHLRLQIYHSTIVKRTKNSSELTGREPLVDAPLSALLGFGRAGQSAMASFDGKTILLRWPIFYDAKRDDFEIQIENNGAQTVRCSFTFDMLKKRALQNPPPYLFHAVYGSTRSQKGVPIPILKVLGSGFLAGLNLSIAPRKDTTRRTFSFLEGNETIDADGVKHEGTGTEDFFNSAWYFPDAPFDRPFHGLTHKQLSPPQVAAYRLMIRDAVPFANSLDFSFEHGSRNRDDDLEWRWVAFWYQKRTDGAPDANKPAYRIADGLARDAERERVAAAKADAEARAKARRQKLFGVWGLAALVALVSVWLLRFSSRRPPGARGDKTAS